jgi:hypothetical protein
MKVLNTNVGNFPFSPNFVTIPNPDLLSSSETEINLGKEAEKNVYLDELDVRKPLMICISKRSAELKLYNMA